MNTFFAPALQGRWRWVGLLAVAWASVARADAKDDVMAAIDKTFAASSYTWASKVAGEPEARAKVGAEGYTSMVITVAGKPQVLVCMGRKKVVQTDAGCKTSKELVAEGGQGPLADAMHSIQGTPRMDMDLPLADVRDMQATGDGQYSGRLIENFVNNALNELGKATTVTDAHGTYTATLKDGYITRTEIHLSGTVTSSDGSKSVDRTDFITISDINSTTVDIPEDAKQALAKPK